MGSPNVYLFRFLIFLFLLASSQNANVVFAKRKLIFATHELSPYIGENLHKQGYVFELISEIYKRAGKGMEIRYYPLERSRILSEKGLVDGILPAFYLSGNNNYLFSDPFPGVTIGLLKKRSLKVKLPDKKNIKIEKLLDSLKKYKFGVLRGSYITKEFHRILSDRVEKASYNLINIDKLHGGRLDFIAIDKYTAADIMVTKRPQYIGKLEFISPYLAEKNFHVAFTKKSSNFKKNVDEFNRVLAEVIRDGTLKKILENHGLNKTAFLKSGKKVLTIGTVNNQDMKIMQNISKSFEKEFSDVKLIWRVLDENTLRLRLSSDLAISDGQFDVMTIGAYEASVWSKRGWIVPINTIPDKYMLKDVLRSVIDSLSFNGEIYALPFYAESSMLYYRKDLFKNQGINMPENPDYYEIRKFASKLHNPSKKVYGIGLRGKAGWGENMCFLSTLINTFGGRWFDEKWNPQINSPEWNKAILFYINLMKKYGPPDPGKNGFNENLKLFMDGKLGMWVDSTVAAGAIFNKRYSKVHDKVGFTNAPVKLTKKGSHWLWTWALAIPSSSNNKALAVKFVLWATSRNYIKKVADKYGWLSVPPGTRKSTYASNKYRSSTGFSDFVLNTIQRSDPKDSTLKPKPYNGIQFVDIPEFASIGDYTGQQIQKALEGKISVSKALTNSQYFAEMQMKRSRHISY